MNDKWSAEQQPWLEGSVEMDGEILNDPVLAEEAFAALEVDAVLKDAARMSSVSNPARRWVGAAGLVAAVLAVVIFLPRIRQAEPDAAMRLRGVGQGPAIESLAPSDTLLSFPRMFRWSAPGRPAGTTYRWELYDAAAMRRAVAVVNDTVLVRRPTDTPGDSLGTWRWLVIEIKPDGNEGSTSSAKEFTVGSGDSP